MKENGISLSPKRSQPRLSKAYCPWWQTCWVWAKLG
jgi:hypothetical protein